jgi:hypothetical protein
MGRAALLALLATAAAAQELRTPGEQVIAELREALAAGDATRALPLLEEAAEIHRHPCGPAEAEALLALIGSATHAADPGLVVAAVRALGRTGAPAAAPWLLPLLRPAKKGEERLCVAAVEAAGQLAAGALLPGLLDLAREGTDPAVAERALLAIGGYARSERDLRERAFRETLQLAQLVSKRAARWHRLAWAALRALQRLSGKRMNSVEQFADWWRHAKARKDPFAPS